MDNKFEYRDRDNKPYYLENTSSVQGNPKLKIYGRTDCPTALYYKARGKYNYSVFFESKEIAVAAGYHPCKRCMPNEFIATSQIKYQTDYAKELANAEEEYANCCDILNQLYSLFSPGAVIQHSVFGSVAILSFTGRILQVALPNDSVKSLDAAALLKNNLVQLDNHNDADFMNLAAYYLVNEEAISSKLELCLQR